MFRREVASAHSPGTQVTLVCNGTPFSVAASLLSALARFRADPSLLGRATIEIQTAVSGEIFSTFVKALSGEAVEITDANFAGLRQLAADLGFDELSQACSAFYRENDGRQVLRICRLQKRIHDKADQVGALKGQLDELQGAVADLRRRAGAAE
jgi:hypothetical protein